MHSEAPFEWLFANSGPVLRYRAAVDLRKTPAGEQEQLRQAALAAPEVQRWLDNLRAAQNIHGSKDTNAENALAKLLEFGFDRTLPAIDAQVKRLLERPLHQWDALVLMPFLIRAGYADHPLVVEWFAGRMARLHLTAQRGSFAFYLDAQSASGVPKAWRGKPVYRDEFGHQAGYPLPTCYDFYALAYAPSSLGGRDISAVRDAIVTYLSDPRFQSTVGGYGWDRAQKRCYAAGRVFLACVELARSVLFLEMGARCPAARASAWFQGGLAALENCRTAQGTYRFPPSMLAERTGYYIYSGSHMGLGEDRRSPHGIELESTFRMLRIRKYMEA